MNLLVVDSDLNRGEALAWSLAAGRDVKAASYVSALDVLRSVRRAVPDGIVVAVDEDEGLLQLRLLHRAFPDAPIVVAASEGDLLSVRRAIVCGAGDYLLRPTASELLEALSRLLEGDDGELGRKAA